jgi:hypothetical protein
VSYIDPSYPTDTCESHIKVTNFKDILSRYPGFSNVPHLFTRVERYSNMCPIKSTNAIFQVWICTISRADRLPPMCVLPVTQHHCMSTSRFQPQPNYCIITIWTIAKSLHLNYITAFELLHLNHSQTLHLNYITTSFELEWQKTKRWGRRKK